MVLQMILRILGLTLLVYSFVITFRILLSWVRQEGNDTVFTTLCRITDPYLNIFRNLHFLRLGGIDFSPIFALAILGILSTILLQLSIKGTITLGWILFITFDTIMQAGISIVILLIIICLVRFLSLIVFKSRQNFFWDRLDSLLFPLLSLFLRIFRHKPAYPQLLLTAILGMLLVVILGTLLRTYLGFLLISIPI